MDAIDAALFFNGINGSSGEYLLPEISPNIVAAAAVGRKLDPAEQIHERTLAEFRRMQQTGHLGTTENVLDPNDLSLAGWGLIVSKDINPRFIEALRPLLDHRKEAAASVKPIRYKEFTDYKGLYRAGETATQWCARQGIGPGPVNPDRGVPYYLLIVGSPDQIPYRFQYHLDVQHAVGRIYFETPDEYRHYAESVIQAEQGLQRPQRVALASVANGTDRATNLSARHLVEPLVKSLQSDERFDGWDIEPSRETTKAAMAELIGGRRSPPLLFTATHGIGFEENDPRQLRHQGALLCQDWPGFEAWGRKPIPPEFYLSADDIGTDANVWGSIFFHFACYGAGTPQEDDFGHYRTLQEQLGGRLRLSPSSFVARLPQRLLSHEAGGALAVIGHVDRAWTWSFSWESVQENTEVFSDLLKRLMRGQRVGFALETFNERYGEIAALLNSELEDVKFGKRLDPLLVADLWTANNDARSYVVVGDPAAQLVFAPDAPAEPPYRSLDLAVRTTRQGSAGDSSSPTSAEPAVPPDDVSPPPAPSECLGLADQDVLAPAGQSVAPAASFGLLDFGRPAVPSGGGEIDTTFVYVHGTGTRAAGYMQQLSDIRKGIQRYLPEARIEVAECFWGGAYGVNISDVQAVLPPERGRAFSGEDDAVTKQERGAALWATLYANPCAELWALATEARLGEGTDLRESFARRLNTTHDIPQVAQLLAEAGASPDDLEAAAKAVLSDLAYQWALGAATHEAALYAAVLARAAVATAIVQAERAGVSQPLARDPELRAALVAAIADALSPGGNFGPVDVARNALVWPLAHAATAWVNLDRTKVTADISPFPGDILRYLCDGSAIRSAVRERLSATQAPVVLAHSLGGIVCVDLLAQERLPWVKQLITVGSQAPFLYQINALPSLRHGQPLPDHFPPWLNIYHRNDLLSYLGGVVFGPRVLDREVQSLDPFPNAHSTYWLNRETWSHIAVALRHFT